MSHDGKIDHLSDSRALPYTELFHASIVESNGQLILTGGEGNLPNQSSKHQDGFYILDTRQNPSGWVEGPKLLTGRSFHFSFLLGDKLFVGGGESQNMYISSLEVLTLTDTHPHWTKVDEDYPVKVNVLINVIPRECNPGGSDKIYFYTLMILAMPELNDIEHVSSLDIIPVTVIYMHNVLFSTFCYFNSSFIPVVFLI